MPWAAADDATPVSSPSSAPARARAARGQAMRPSKPYRRTLPGAPVSAVAVPVSTMPRPSPKNHTPRAQAKDTARAGRTVGL